MVPAYGDGALLRETIDSVLRQHDPAWRLTVVDDDARRGGTHGAARGGDDDAARRGGELAAWLADLGDDRLRYLPNRTRLGINRNFQRCADLARAELVVLLGADDRLLPDFVGRVRRAAAEVPDAAFIHTGATVIDQHGRPALPLADRVKRIATPPISGRRVMGGEDLAASLLHGNWMYFPSVAFRREVLQRHGFRPGYDIVLDLDLYLRILLAGGSAVLFAEPAVEYRRHRGSLSSAQALDGSRFAEELAYFAEAAALAEAACWPRAARAARWHWTSRLHSVAKIPGVLAAGDGRTAAVLLRTAAASCPRGVPCDEGAR